ncbi:MAG TPA: malto-oligosyltrehalose synthase, partial [Egibacteraceae bacterium]|nr:malto-oligosyltrehalose synthase [Egibacteraceae bacterium]
PRPCALAASAHGRGLGVVVDIVPNHVGVHHTNAMWDGLLARGPAGDEARCFDVNWDSALPGSAQKVILPVLGEQYGEVLHSGELEVLRDSGSDPGRGWRLRYHEHDFPLSEESCQALERSGGGEALRGEPGVPDTWQRLHALLERQHYRLVHWRVGHRVINYRRFFAVDTLAAVRVEDEVVFDRVHGKILQLVGDGVVDGLRVDHPDGLRDPGRYLERLRERAGGVWIVVEKILQHAEALRDWPVEGTTGYEFCNDVLGLFVDPEGEAPLSELDRELGGRPDELGRVERECKRQILAEDLASEHQRLTGMLWRLAQEHPTVRDLDDRHVAEAIAGAIAHMEVYRAYIDPQTGRATPEDVERVEGAVERARAAARGGGQARRGQAGPPDEVFDLVAAAASGRLGTTVAHLDFAARFAQLSSAVMAKGVEDTAFYRYQRLLALNEVGGHPGRFGTDAAAFHRANAQRQACHPAGMLTTATHDTKRGEDARLRVAALSERPAEWAALARRWAPGAPDGHAASLALQTLVAVWPLAGGPPDEEVRRRVHAYLVKALREARLRTDWAEPDEGYELGVAEWLDGLLGDDGFVGEFGGFVGGVQEIAMTAGVAQTLLRLTSPGVPDTYQGCELWEDALVDPDNRRAVDFGARERLLAELGARPDAAALWAARRDGRVKLWVLRRALQVRNTRPACFGPDAGYEPLRAEGAMADHVVAFARTSPDGERVITVAPRLPGRVLAQGWGDTTLDLGGTGYVDALTGRPATDRLADLTATLPVALLTR